MEKKNNEGLITKEDKMKLIELITEANKILNKYHERQPDYTTITAMDRAKSYGFNFLKWCSYLEIKPEITKPELAPCPFCKNNDNGTITIIPCSDDECNTEDCGDCEYISYAVVCSASNGGCGASSGWKPTKEEAINAWNESINNKNTSNTKIDANDTNDANVDANADDDKFYQSVKELVNNIKNPVISESANDFIDSIKKHTLSESANDFISSIKSRTFSEQDIDPFKELIEKLHSNLENHFGTNFYIHRCQHVVDDTVKEIINKFFSNIDGSKNTKDE